MGSSLPGAEKPAPTRTSTRPTPPDSAEELWVPLRSWTSARPGRPVLLAALALILLQAIIRGYVLFGGYFLYDDFAFIGRAQSQPLWSSEYLFTSWNGHVMPGAFAYVHLLTGLWPVDYVPVVLGSLVLQAVLAVLVYAILSALFGRRPAILVPLAFFLFTTTTLPATAWWAAALNQLPGMTSVAAALWFHIRYHRRGRLLDGLLGVVSLLVGLAFSEKVLLAIPVVLALSLLYFTPGAPATRIRACIRSSRAVWGAYVGIGVLYATYYLVAVPTPVGSNVSADLVATTMGVNLFDALLPAAYGGPFRWMRLGVGAISDTPYALVVLAAVFTALVITWSVYRRYRAVFGWLVLLGYWAANAAILGMTRAATVGPIIGREYRYSTDVALIAAVFGALALLPIRGDAVIGHVQRLIPRRPATAPSRSGSGSYEAPVAVAATVALVVAASISTMQFDTMWRNQVTPKFVATAVEDLRRANTKPVVMADLPFPDSAAPNNTPLGARAQWVLGALPERPVFLTDGHFTNQLYVLDDAGHVREAAIDGFRNKPGPDQGCGWRINEDPVTVPLQGTTMAWVWFTRVGYIASLDGQVRVTVGVTTTTVDVKAGVNQFFVLGSGAIDEVTFSGLTYGTMCTDEIAVGFAKPVPQTQP